MSKIPKNIVNDNDASIKKIADFMLTNIMSFEITASKVNPILIEDYNKELKKLRGFYKTIGLTKKIKSRKINLNLDSYLIYSKYKKEFEISRNSALVMPRTLFISLVSYFEHFLKELLRVILKDDSLMLTSEKKYSVEELLEINTKEELRSFLIRSEAESIFENRFEYFDWLKKKLDLDLKKSEFLRILWTNFNEIYERRNLFVHNNGIITKRYLSLCAKLGIKVSSKLKEGDELKVDAEYFFRASNTLRIFSVILSQIIWRKIVPSKVESDKYIINTCAELVEAGRAGSAYNILDFAISEIKKFHSKVNEQMIIINKAWSLKILSKQKDSEKLLNSYDWSAAGLDFQIVIAVLKNQFTKAVTIMDKIGKDKEMRANYKMWPIFKELILRDDFKNKYKNIYGEEFKFEITETT